MNKILIFFALATFSTCKSGDENENTIYKMGFKTDTSSTGPLDNSAFILKVNDTLPPVLVTAHHTVAGIGNERYLKWDEIEKKQKNAWAWSMQDSTFGFKVGSNLPIRNAGRLKLDVAAFRLPSDEVPYLKPAKKNVQPGDTVYLFSKITFENKVTLVNPAVVIYLSDSLLVYELTDFNMARIMGGTSGSAVINKDHEVVSNSFGGFTIPSNEIKKEIATRFPLLNKLDTKNGKTYGFGLPIRMIETSITQAFEKPDNLEC